MSSSVGPGIVTVIVAPPAQQAPHDDRDPWLVARADAVMASPLTGQPGHGSTAFVRRQPVRIVCGRFEGGYTNVFELICPGCGDHPYLDYSEVSPRLQWLRGPRSLAASLAAYHKHLGPLYLPENQNRLAYQAVESALSRALAAERVDMPRGR